MRIIAGRLKGRPLRGPTGAGVRPTSDRLRETLFNVLRERVQGARVLEGYAGTGAIGLEAISRGAAEVTFIENDRGALTVLRQNIDACDVAAVCTVLRGDCVNALRAGVEGPFDLVILDPPYDVRDLDGLLAAAAAAVAPSGLLVLEHARRRDTPARVPGLARARLLNAGDSALSFYAPAPSG